jgi:hypothetical protein
MRPYPFILLFLEMATAFPHLKPSTKTDRTWFRRRQDSQDMEAEGIVYKKIETTGAHAWQAPGPNDKYLVPVLSWVSPLTRLIDVVHVQRSTPSPTMATYLAMALWE